MDTSIHNILTGNIKPSPMNPRKSFNEDALRELADNISRQGLLQPITVRPLSSIDGATVVAKNVYEIVCGERRYRACIIHPVPQPDVEDITMLLMPMLCND